ncbi:MAG: hypothetical protein Q9170_000032 [Blastenia crenularia]
MAPASVTSFAGYSGMGYNLSDAARYPGWQDYSTITDSKLARDGVSISSSLNLQPQQARPGSSKQEQPETPTPKKPRNFVQLRPSAEKYNPSNRFHRQRSPPVPEAELNTSKLADAFPGFSGCADDVKPLSPNPFVSATSGHKLKMPSWAGPQQPRVRDENDVSIPSETRSSPAKLANKNTRFGGINNPKTRKAPQPHLYQPSTGLAQKVDHVEPVSLANEAKLKAIDTQGSLISMPNGSTQSTVNLPRGTNLTDLFSGVVRQPHPANTRQERPRPSRFTSAAKTHSAAEPKAEQIPVPVDERHLLESIEVLQNRVAELEDIKAQLEGTNNNLDQKNFELEIEKRELTARRRSDSAVSATDNASDDNKGPTAAHRRIIAEKKRLESTCWALQGQKDLLLRDVGIAEATVSKVTQELNQCQAQLSSAKSDIEQLQTEKAVLGQQRAQAVAQLVAANADNETLLQEKDVLLDENEQLRAQIALLTQKSAAKEDSTSEHSMFGHDDADFAEEPLDMDTLSNMHQQQKREQQQKEQQKGPQVEQEKPANVNSRSLESSHNITYLSYPGDSSICKVRRTLEQERKARQQRRNAENPAVNYIEQKDTGAFDGQARQPSDSSVIKRPKRQIIPRDELTSGFILPDITFNVRPVGGIQASLPGASQPRIEDTQQASAQQNTEQTNIIDLPLVQAYEQPSQQTAELPKLPRISDEELDITIHDEEPSVRPSQPPDVALAMVMESLRTELAQQRAQMAKYQHSYDRQDVAMSRRQRKQILGKIQTLLASCDVKADQIYNLQDVIEGHKKQGQPITQNQVDNTLQSLGLDLPWEGIESTTPHRRRSTTSSRSI